MLNNILMGLVLITTHINALININDSRINARDLFVAALQNNDLPTVKYFIDNGFDVKSENYLYYFIDRISHYNYYKKDSCPIEMVRLLLDSGCNLYMDWHWDNSYLNCLVRERCALHHSHLESREKMLEIIKLMLSYDSQIVTTLKTKNNLHKNVFNLATEAADFTLIKILQDASKQ